jgi:threonine dehydrogenase-like Zn-dependent dehydrogenase
LEIHVLGRNPTGLKPELVGDLGAAYHTGELRDVGFAPDVIIECTGVGQVIVDSIRQIGSGGVLCLTGVGSGGQTSSPPAADIATELVLQNNVIVGSVNANRRHFYRAGEALAAADPRWLARLLTRRVAPANIEDAFHREPDDIKVIVDFAG